MKSALSNSKPVHLEKDLATLTGIHNKKHYLLSDKKTTGSITCANKKQFHDVFLPSFLA